MRSVLYNNMPWHNTAFLYRYGVFCSKVFVRNLTNTTVFIYLLGTRLLFFGIYDKNVINLPVVYTVYGWYLWSLWLNDEPYMTIHLCLTFQQHNPLLDVLCIFTSDQTPGVFELGVFGHSTLRQLTVVFLLKFLSKTTSTVVKHNIFVTATVKKMYSQTHVNLQPLLYYIYY